MGEITAIQAARAASRIARFSFWGPIASALLLILSFPVFPRFQLWPVAWVGLVPLLVCLQNPGWKQRLLAGAAFGYPFIIGVLAWVRCFGTAPWLALCFFEGAWFIGFALLVSLAVPSLIDPQTPVDRIPTKQRRVDDSKNGKTAAVSTARPFGWGRHAAALLLPACAWIVIEWMRSLGTLSIPWGNLSHTQIHIAPLVSTARWWGAYGVTFMIVAVNSGIANCVVCRGPDRRRAALALLACVLVIAASCLVSVITLPADTGAPLKFALIQGNVTREHTATVTEDPVSFQTTMMGVYRTMSQKAALQRPAVIVWPETVVPGPLLLDPTLLREVTDLAHQTHATMVVGSPHFTPQGDYNSAFVVSPERQVLGRYDKGHLVPFGEYTPFMRSFFARYGSPEVDLLRGRGHRPIPTPLADLGVMICYESMYPQIARQTTLNGAQILVVVTNDQWFGTSSAPYDHASDAPFRAAETGRWLAQAGTTGISLFADPAGHVYEATKMFTRATDVMNIYPRSEITLYTRLGDWPAIVSIFILLGAIGFRRASADGVFRG